MNTAPVLIYLILLLEKESFPWFSSFPRTLDFCLLFWRQGYKWWKFLLLNKKKKKRLETKSWPHARHWQSSLTQGNQNLAPRPFCQHTWTQAVIVDILRRNEMQTQWQLKGSSNESQQVFWNCCCANLSWKEVLLWLPLVVVTVFLSFSIDRLTEILTAF